MIPWESVASLAQRRINSAVGGWRRGLVTEEVALLNRLGEQFTALGSCQINSTTLIDVDWQVLHRQGSHGRDLYGSDLAVTVIVLPEVAVKTAFFQLKCSHNYAIRITREQLQQASIIPEIADRYFLVGANSSNADVRIGTIPDIPEFLSSGQEQRQVRYHRWWRSRTWIESWLRCMVGPRSHPLDMASVEALLNSVVERPIPYKGYDHMALDSRVEEVFRDVPPDFLPARAWMTTVVEGETEV